MNIKIHFVRCIHGLKHFCKTHKNDILFGAGVVTEVAAVIVTAKKSIKNTQEQMLLSDECDKYIDDPNDDAEVLAEKDIKRHEIYRKSLKTTIKNYAIPAGLTLVSVAFYGKAHLNLKSELAATTAALAAEHALNQKLLQGVNPQIEQKEDGTQEVMNAPYSGGIPNDLDSQVIDNAVIVYDSDNGYFAEKDGYAQPCTVVLSPTAMTFEKAEYSDWEPCHDLNIMYIQNKMKDISRNIKLFGFVNLNEVRKFFVPGRNHKLEEAENYYILWDDNRGPEEQVSYRIYVAEDESGKIIPERLWIDIFNTKVPKPGDLKEAKQRAIAANPLLF